MRPKNITFGTIMLVKVILVDVNVIVVLVKEVVEVVVEKLVSCRRQQCHHHENEPHKALKGFSRHQPRVSSPLPRPLLLLWLTPFFAAPASLANFVPLPLPLAVTIVLATPACFLGSLATVAVLAAMLDCIF